MKKIRFLIDYLPFKAKVGDEVNVDDKGAKEFIRLKYAEYVEEDQVKEIIEKIRTGEIKPGLLIEQIDLQLNEMLDETNPSIIEEKIIDLEKRSMYSFDKIKKKFELFKLLQPKKQIPTLLFEEGSCELDFGRDKTEIVFKDTSGNVLNTTRLSREFWKRDRTMRSFGKKLKEIYGLSSVDLSELNRKIQDIHDGWKGQLKQEKEIEQENLFNFELIKPKHEIKTLEQLKEIVVRNFPDNWEDTLACLSIYLTLSLKSLNGCPSLTLVGSPSDNKTTIASFFYGAPLSYISDDFTPRSFVSHATNVAVEELEGVDLLPKLKNKVLITPELAPLFEGTRDKLLENFPTLTRVLDGEGLNRDTGAHGHRGYSGDYKFVWIGCTTPLRSAVWSLMGKIGNRLFFLNVQQKKRTNEDYMEMFMGKEFEEKVKECRGAMHSFLSNHFKKYPVRSLKWNNAADALILKEIIKYSKLLSKLRGSLVAWKSDEERGKIEHTFPIIEEPPRCINSLRNIAKGHALSMGRTFLKIEDLRLIRRVCLSSMPYDRHKFLELLMANDGRLSSAAIEKELSCSKDTALRTMEVFRVLGVVKINDLAVGEGRPLKFVELNDEFRELLNEIQVDNPAINSKSVRTEGMRVQLTKENQEKKEEMVVSTEHTTPPIPQINSKSQENNPVSQEKEYSIEPITAEEKAKWIRDNPPRK